MLVLCKVVVAVCALLTSVLFEAVVSQSGG